jgi:hypothetical protein
MTINNITTTALAAGIVSWNKPQNLLSFIHSFSSSSQLEQWVPFGVSAITHMFRHTVEHLWTSDQTVTETSTYTGQHNIAYKHKRQTSMSRTGFEPSIPVTKRRRSTYALYRAATGVGKIFLHILFNLKVPYIPLTSFQLYNRCS